MYRKDKIQAEISRRTRSLEYNIRHPNSGLEVRLCRTVFCNVFDISVKLARRAAQGSNDLQCTPEIDGRGKHAIKNDDIETAKQHRPIRSFPRYRSHYSLRDNPHKSYITSLTSVENMYRLYCKTVRRATLYL